MKYILTIIALTVTIFSTTIMASAQMKWYTNLEALPLLEWEHRLIT